MYPRQLYCIFLALTMNGICIFFTQMTQLMDRPYPLNYLIMQHIVIVYLQYSIAMLVSGVEPHR